MAVFVGYMSEVADVWVFKLGDRVILEYPGFSTIRYSVNTIRINFAATSCSRAVTFPCLQAEPATKVAYCMIGTRSIPHPLWH